MRQVPPAYRAMAHWLLEQEARREGPPDMIDAAERVFEKLHSALANLIGSGGFRSVFLRALHLSATEQAAFGRVAAASEGASLPSLLGGMRASLAEVEPAEAREDVAAVLGNLLWLLSSFIGVGLTERKVRMVWPGLPAIGAGTASEEAGK